MLAGLGVTEAAGDIHSGSLINELESLVGYITGMYACRRLHIGYNPATGAEVRLGEEIVLCYRLIDGTRDQLVFAPSDLEAEDAEKTILSPPSRRLVMRLAAAVPRVETYTWMDKA